ncbi:MAG TPA: transporter [Steroidobacteraceae bacterium]|nr:transporter [Steroidobacteraceae bacterium]
MALARAAQIGQIPVNLTATVNANVNANVNLASSRRPIFATPVLGGQASASMLAAYGNNSTSLAGSFAGTVTGPAGGSVPFSLSDNINSSLTAFGDLIPQFALKWNSGVNNYMTYVTADLPAGAYQSSRLANLGIGHWAIDAGGGYTYFDPKTGHEASAVLGFTHNFINPATQYQNGVDMHLDWGASQFLTKQWQVGPVGYLYQEIGCGPTPSNRDWKHCDSGSGVCLIHSESLVVLIREWHRPNFHQRAFPSWPLDSSLRIQSRRSGFAGAIVSDFWILQLFEDGARREPCNPTRVAVRNKDVDALSRSSRLPSRRAVFC